MAIRIIQRPDGVSFNVKVVPGASRDRIAGLLGDALKVAVSKPPSGGAANQAVIALLTEALGLSRGSVTIARGYSNPRKEIFVRGITADELRQRVSANCARNSGTG
jgi:uncharacterized protein (TIGR00251 family)